MSLLTASSTTRALAWVASSRLAWGPETCFQLVVSAPFSDHQGAAAEGHLGRAGGTQIAAGIGNRRLVDRRQAYPRRGPAPCMALRMSPLSASISQANRPPSWFASTYCWPWP